MYEVSRTYPDAFCSAHMLPGHDKCGRLHGHNYTLEVVCESEQLDREGMVVDYHAIDEAVRPVLAMLDHRLIDTYETEHSSGIFPAGSTVLPIDWTTSECLARWIFEILRSNNLTQLKEVSLWETSKSKATYRP